MGYACLFHHSVQRRFHQGPNLPIPTTASYIFRPPVTRRWPELF